MRTFAQAWLTLLAVLTVGGSVVSVVALRAVHPVLLFHALVVGAAAYGLWRRTSWSRSLAVLTCLWLAGNSVLVVVSALTRGGLPALRDAGLVGLAIVVAVLAGSVVALVGLSRASAPADA